MINYAGSYLYSSSCFFNTEVQSNTDDRVEEILILPRLEDCIYLEKSTLYDILCTI